MENIYFVVKTISSDGLDTVAYDSDFYIQDGILYYLDEELSRDTEDLMDVVGKIMDYCHDTVLEITDDNDEVIYKNEEFEDEEMDWEDGSEPYSDDKELRYNDYFGESFKSLNEKLEKFLGE